MLIILQQRTSQSMPVYDEWTVSTLFKLLTKKESRKVLWLFDSGSRFAIMAFFAELGGNLEVLQISPFESWAMDRTWVPSFPHRTQTLYFSIVKSILHSSDAKQPFAWQRSCSQLAFIYSRPLTGSRAHEISCGRSFSIHCKPFSRTSTYASKYNITIIAAPTPTYTRHPDNRTTTSIILPLP
jgi:hypothetical protein